MGPMGKSELSDEPAWTGIATAEGQPRDEHHEHPEAGPQLKE